MKEYSWNRQISNTKTIWGSGGDAIKRTNKYAKISTLDVISIPISTRCDWSRSSDSKWPVYGAVAFRRRENVEKGVM